VSRAVVPSVGLQMLVPVVLHRHLWNHLAGLQRRRREGGGGGERETDRDRKNVNGEGRGLEADAMYKMGSGSCSGRGVAATDGPAPGIEFCANTTCVEPDESCTGMSAAGCSAGSAPTTSGMCRSQVTGLLNFKVGLHGALQGGSVDGLFGSFG
jgi:hypothetical protein